MDRAWTTQLRKGLTELTVLAALREGETYGYELLQRLAKTNLLATTPATLYPILARLEEERLVAVREGPSPSGPPRRYYRLTTAGNKQLAEMVMHWQQLAAAMGQLLESQPTEKTAAA